MKIFDSSKNCICSLGPLSILYCQCPAVLGIYKGWSGAGMGGMGSSIFSPQGVSQQGGRPSLIYVVHLSFWKKENSVHSCLKTSILLDHPWLTGLSSEHRHQTLSQIPLLGALTFACICSFLSLDLRGFCRIPSICRKGAKRAHGQGDETD